MSAIPFLIAGCAVLVLVMIAIYAAWRGLDEFTELDRPLPARFRGGARLPTQRDPDAEEDGEDR